MLVTLRTLRHALAIEYDGATWRSDRAYGHRDSEQHREDNAREERLEVWRRISTDLTPRHLDRIAQRTIPFDELPGADPSTGVAGLAEQAHRLNEDPVIHRDAVWALKRNALDDRWRASGPDLRFERWRADQGADLETYARFCALAEHYGEGWHAWPAEHRHPDRPGVGEFAAVHREQVAFWAWVQFHLGVQLRRAEESTPLLTDLAIGVDPDGADAWIMQDLLADGVRVGAPPDAFNRQGQDWGLPPFRPAALRAAAYAPLARLWAAAMGHGGGLRIDHVMGLFRLFWIPPGGGPADGAYVRYRGDELLAVLAVESVRSGAVVVGEDLGTVEPDVRAALADAGVLSYRLAWFEDEPPEHYPNQALAAVTTHDLPTVAGVWSGDDAADQRAAGIEPDELDAAWRLEATDGSLDDFDRGGMLVTDDAAERLGIGAGDALPVTFPETGEQDLPVRAVVHVHRPPRLERRRPFRIVLGRIEILLRRGVLQADVQVLDVADQQPRAPARVHRGPDLLAHDPLPPLTAAPHPPGGAGPATPAGTRTCRRTHATCGS